MRPARGATPVLLHDPLHPRDWGRLPSVLGDAFGAAIAVEAGPLPEERPYAARYIASVSQRLTEDAPASPLLIAEGGAGPLLAQVGSAQRAAHRAPAGYILVDAPMPRPAAATRYELHVEQTPDLPLPESPEDYFSEVLPMVADWPDAPCGYLLTDAAYAPCARLAAMRGWPVEEAPGADDPAEPLLKLLSRL